ncbi:TPA: hypothetical protein PXN94_004163 [Yersinia enterocolitica]|nr:hypothetical protein [Yersinia enterocolitica]
MHTTIIIFLGLACFVLACVCFVLYRMFKEKSEHISDPNASFKIISTLCNKVNKGSDLDRLEHEMNIGLKVLGQRKENG